MAWLVGLYDGGIRHVDDWFGRLIARLRELGIYDRAIIVVISDHGEEFDEHDAMDHYGIYSPVARVPMIIRLPAQTRGLRHRATVQTVDLMPTLLDLVGAHAPGPFDGRSLAPLLRGERLPPKLAFTESPFSGSQTAVADANFRILHTDRVEAVELFDYRSDVLEQRDVAADYPEVRERLRQAARRYHREVRSLYDSAGNRPAAEIDSDLEAQLEALGYVE
jgi:arylsulfatase A-like enzyme